MSVSVPRAGRSLSTSELGAWRGLLCAHAALTKTLDAELEQSHGVGLTSYEVLVRLDRAPGRRMRMCELADSVLLSRSGVTRRRLARRTSRASIGTSSRASPAMSLRRSTRC
jgi:hypothetical protein